MTKALTVNDVSNLLNELNHQKEVYENKEMDLRNRGVIGEEADLYAGRAQGLAIAISILEEHSKVKENE
ncbi:hypothetical protein G3A_07005 [Bacillus sp. 17376]|uniref:Phage protein n=1 Tax=Mesobacillus boroniphilus JCM 21738 TaxID=1294265 RepID=W4RQP0_9BACI|nr:hypothetical protein [Mesobacillus boroniphilus]ESU33261.1 hypothetical protein G3A_07005 [Bacillus sp. 17376]GAE46208.1 hypothetical protein JCM21738_3090 [Mesobacillus boroniphilus JCM 21738]